jgi:plasmid replication initiation protein
MNDDESGQLDMFGGVEGETPVEREVKQDRGRRQMEPLLPDRRRQRDFFLCDILDPTLKDDMGTMEHPMFSLSTKTDTAIRRYEHKGNSIEIAPSMLGLATIKDKDILIYCVSQLVEAINLSREDVSRTVRVTVYDLLRATNRRTDGDEYKRLRAAFKRLRGTNITTNIMTNGVRITNMFGLLDEVNIIEKSPDDERMIAVEITLSKWLYNAVLGMEVLSISPDYFRLRKPLDRRLYELARKHCGPQTKWKVGLALLHKKSGSTSALWEFRRMVKQLTDSNHLPDYSVAYDENRDQVSFWTRNHAKLMKAITGPKGREVFEAMPSGN